MSDREQLEETLAVFRSLVKHQGWGLLVKQMLVQEAQRREAVAYTPLKSIDEVTGQEFMKGEAAGIRLMRSTPAEIIDQIEGELELMRGAEDDDRDQ